MKNDETTIEALKKIAEDIAKFSGAVIKFCQDAAAIFASFAEQATNVILASSTDNKRIFHLALYHPKEKVRKKNFNRLIREMRR